MGLNRSCGSRNTSVSVKDSKTENVYKACNGQSVVACFQGAILCQMDRLLSLKRSSGSHGSNDTKWAEIELVDYRLQVFLWRTPALNENYRINRK